MLLTFFKFTNGTISRKVSHLYTFVILRCSLISQTMSGKRLYLAWASPLPPPTFLTYFYIYFRPRLSKAIHKVRKTGFKFFTLSFHAIKNGRFKIKLCKRASKKHWPWMIFTRERHLRSCQTSMVELKNF